MQRYHEVGGRRYPIVSSEYGTSKNAVNSGNGYTVRGDGGIEEGANWTGGRPDPITDSVYNNPGGYETFGAEGQAGITRGVDKRGPSQNMPRTDYYNNTLHGVNITVNDWAYANGNADDFDAFSASLQSLEPLRGTKEAEDEIRNMLTSAGFSYTDDQIAYWLADQGEGGLGEAFAGAAPEAPRPSIINDFHNRIDTAVTATRGDITKPGAGHESTVKVPKTLAAVNARAVTNNNIPKAPADRVVNPSTGVVYNSPAEARRAGVVNWVYLSEEQVA